MAIIEAGLLLALVYVDLAGVPGPARAAHAGEALPQPVHALAAIGTPRLLPAHGSYWPIPTLSVVRISQLECCVILISVAVV